MSFLRCLLAVTVVLTASRAAVAQDQPTNRLVKESSPYLLQHAHNPVDWYPWGDEALEKAKREGKMIFLSVGYAACHWCHVMERESFMDPEIARVMNERFVCVKVDREERPDVDQIYMTAVQLISGNGGWPMSVFLLPDTRPFWGGTYFPARDGDRGNAPGFLSVMNQIDQAWKTQRNAVLQQADALTAAIKANQNPDADPVEQDALQLALVGGVVDSLFKQYDPVHGGFGVGPNRPKFPEPSNLVFLLDRWQRESIEPEQRESAERMLVKTLDGMISGAMYDHLGGGFHRYSVDQRWQIPHFEKMLYDNGQLASIYAEAYQISGNEEYRHVVEGTCDFVLRELRAPGGAFFSALDADSEGEEGKFYRWTAAELEAIESDWKGERGSEEIVEIYRLGGKPNFEGEFFAPDPGSTLTAIARQRGETFAELNRRIAPRRSELFEIRGRRERPFTDTKILTAWNGLMIAGLADAGRILHRDDYTMAAIAAAEFLVRELRTDEGRLLRTYAGGKAKLNAYVDDYAFLTSGLIALHRATGEPRWLQLAREVTDKQIELFWDEAGGFYFTSADHPSLIVRVKDPVDSAIPAGTSVSAENLHYLAQHYSSSDYEARLRKTLLSIVPLIRKAPAAAPRATAVVAELCESED